MAVYDNTRPRLKAVETDLVSVHSQITSIHSELDDFDLSTKADITYVDAAIATVQDGITTLSDALENIPNFTYVDSALADKVSNDVFSGYVSDTADELVGKADQVALTDTNNNLAALAATAVRLTTAEQVFIGTRIYYTTKPLAPPAGLSVAAMAGTSAFGAFEYLNYYLYLQVDGETNVATVEVLGDNLTGKIVRVTLPTTRPSDATYQLFRARSQTDQTTKLGQWTTATMPATFDDVGYEADGDEWYLAPAISLRPSRYYDRVTNTFRMDGVALSAQTVTATSLAGSLSANYLSGGAVPDAAMGRSLTRNDGGPGLSITQNGTWNGFNYALRVTGYSYLGGFRVNGADNPNSIYAATGGPMGFTVNNGQAITFNHFGGGSPERMRIHSNGCVGIGTASPSETLDVNGNIKSSGTVKLGTYTVGTLPTAGTAGRTAFATNGRKPGQGSGAGTGMPVTDDGTAWRIYDGTTVQA